jgi:hypothetical protein
VADLSLSSKAIFTIPLFLPAESSVSSIATDKDDPRTHSLGKIERMKHGAIYPLLQFLGSLISQRFLV